MAHVHMNYLLGLGLVGRRSLRHEMHRWLLANDQGATLVISIWNILAEAIAGNRP
jgi:hypothetical protein